MTEIQQEMERLDREITERRIELNRLKRSVAGPISGTYRFAGTSGATTLADLFGDRDDLIVVHNMGRNCPYCTMWGDGLNGLYNHIANRASCVLASPDDPSAQREFAQSRQWRMPMISDPDGVFTRDMGYLQTHEGRDYWLPGYSTFHRAPDGIIHRVASDFFGPGDVYCGAWHMFDLLNDGTGDWHPAIRY